MATPSTRFYFDNKITSAAWLSDRGLMVSLTGLLSLLYLAYIFLHPVDPDNFIRGDSYYYRATVISLVEDGDLFLENNVAKDPLNGQLALGVQGKLVPKHPILLPLLSLPFYLVGGSYGLLLFNLIATLGLILLLFKLNRLFFDPPIAFVTTLFYATGALFFNFSYNYSPDILATVLVLGGLYAIWRERRAWGVLLLGLSIFAKLTSLAPVGLIGLYLLGLIWPHPGQTGQPNRWPALLKLGLVFLLSLAPMLAANAYLFGSILTNGYQQTAIAGSGPGDILLVDHTSRFNQPLGPGLVRLLFDSSRGLIPTNPVLVLAFFGLFCLRRRDDRAPFYLIGAICLAQLLFFARYDEWNASHFSNRFLMVTVALSSIFAAGFLAWVRDKWQTAPRRLGWAMVGLVPMLLGLNLYYEREELAYGPWAETAPVSLEPVSELTGLGLLFDYRISPEAGVRAGDTLEVEIRWQPLAAEPDSLVLRWLDSTGYEWGRSRAVPAGPDEAGLFSSAATLFIPPATPPGLYRLRAGLVAADSDKLLGDFNLPGEMSQLIIAPGQILTDPAQLSPAYPLHKPLAPDLTLLGYDPPAQPLTPQAPTWLTLYWQATAQPPDYLVELKLLDQAGEPVAHWQGRPGHGQYPTSHWQPGQIVRDVWALPVEPETPPGRYNLEISLIDPAQPQTPNPKSQIPNLEVWPQPLTYEQPVMQTELTANFGQQLTLLGYDLYFDTGGAGRGRLAPIFYWRSRADFAGAFDLVLTLRAAETGQVVQTWSAPLGPEGLKSLWKAGEIVTTAYALEVEAGLGGAYHLDVALKEAATGTTLPVTPGDSPPAGFVRLEQIQNQVVVRLDQ